MKNKTRNLLQFSKPETEREILNNILYFREEIEFMDNLQFLKLDMTPSIPYGSSINWRFLEKTIPKLNAYFLELWSVEERELEERIKRLKAEYNKLQ